MVFVLGLSLLTFHSIQNFYNMKNLIFALFGMILIVGCGSQKNTASTDDTGTTQDLRTERRSSGDRPARGERAEKPSIDDIFKMDVNNDGLLSKTEVLGPLERDFDKIDTDNDGFLSKTEVEKAPKPERGQRGQKGGK